MNAATPLRIAMWSGPRNISTAMMRAFENRPDTAVVDEPFYAAWLKASGADHPMHAEVLAAQPNDWRDVVSILVGAVPGGRAAWPGFRLDRCGRYFPRACGSVGLGQ